MPTEYSTRYYEPGDERGIVDLLSHAFNGWPKLRVDPLDYWRWKYVDSPYWKNDVSVALRGDQIIGCKHSVYQKIKVGDEILECTLGSDLAVHSDFRGKGVYKQLSAMSSGRKVELGYDISYFVTSNPVLINRFRGEHESLPHKIVVYVLIKDIEKQIESMPIGKPFLKKIAYRGASAANRAARVMDKKIKPFKGSVLRVKGFDERLDGWWAAVSPSYDFVVRRDAQYLNWRYADPRAGEHVVWLAEEEGQAVGYCVVNINRYLEQYPVAYLMDVFSLPGRDDITSALLGEVARFFEEDDCNIITALAVEGGKTGEALSRFGFLNSREELNLFIGRHGLRVGDEAIKSVINNSTPNTIHFSYGDIDSLPVTPPETN